MGSEKFSISAQSFKYWEIFLSWLFKYESRCYARKEKKLIYENPSKDFNQFGATYRKKGSSKGLICHFTPHFEDIKTTCAIFKMIHETIEDAQMCEWATCEVIAKVLAYRNLKVGHQIPFAIMTKDQTIEMAPYVVDHVFDLWNTVEAFGLVRLDHREGPPLLLFRGTDFSLMSQGGRASIMSDLDPKGPGYILFEKGKKQLHEWLGKRAQKARVIGHSLGGAIATYTLIHESDLISQQKHESSYAFNFPGIAKQWVAEWNALQEKPAFKGFVCRGDLVSKLGNLFGQVYEVSTASPLSPIYAHEMLFFSQPRGFLHEVDLIQENESPSRQYYSKLQQQTSSIIYEFGLKFLFKN